MVDRKYALALLSTRLKLFHAWRRVRQMTSFQIVVAILHVPKFIDDVSAMTFFSFANRNYCWTGSNARKNVWKLYVLNTVSISHDRANIVEHHCFRQHYSTIESENIVRSPLNKLGIPNYWLDKLGTHYIM